MPRNKTPLESAEQREIIKWATRHQSPPDLGEPERPHWPELRFLFAVPNSTFTHPAVAINMKKQGVKSGVPDLLLPARRKPYVGLAIELKRRKGGRLAPQQAAWGEYLTKQGWMWAVCKGHKEATELIEKYLTRRTT